MERRVEHHDQEYIEVDEAELAKFLKLSSDEQVFTVTGQGPFRFLLMRRP
jgi:hypothetical protein